MKLSAKYKPADYSPLTGDELLETCCEYQGNIARAGVSISENGGASRTRIAPKILEVGDASAVEVAETLWSIAWAHTCKMNRPMRYVAELTVIEDGRPRSAPVRVYFDMEPENDAPRVDVAANSNAPSLEYVRGLEQQNLRLSERLSRAAMRTMASRERDMERESNLVARLFSADRNAASLEIERVQVEHREKRRDRILDGVVRMLPAMANRLLPAAVGAPDTRKPTERMAELLGADRMARLHDALGPALWEALDGATNIEDARAVLANLNDETAQAMLEVCGEDAIFKMSEWR